MIALATPKKYRAVVGKTLPMSQVAEAARYLDERRSERSYLFKGLISAFYCGPGFRKGIEGYEAMHAIRKGQIRWSRRPILVAQRQFTHTIFGLAA